MTKRGDVRDRDRGSVCVRIDEADAMLSWWYYNDPLYKFRGVKQLPKWLELVIAVYMLMPQGDYKTEKRDIEVKRHPGCTWYYIIVERANAR